ncbi:hypothetical protein G7047_14565 [Diaphorobacter sp. HDW4A]|uniref:hypothetical protein n=1 Tax=Diaphorobacter sp. HDW4A TaxID=2714924 RepID=UPI001409C90C|nr:hypothetical protein [Diaphorobacter sp. HDW4A]QIL80981.1 hypothetical protein G7047_14565 [Diaphorobacter sp. HDW4A]
MITTCSSLKFDFFAQTLRKRKIDEVGDPLQVIAQYFNVTEFAALVDGSVSAVIPKAARRRMPRVALATRGPWEISVGEIGG